MFCLLFLLGKNLIFGRLRPLKGTLSRWFRVQGIPQLAHINDPFCRYRQVYAYQGRYRGYILKSLTALLWHFNFLPVADL